MDKQDKKTDLPEKSENDFRKTKTKAEYRDRKQKGNVILAAAAWIILGCLLLVFFYSAALSVVDYSFRAGLTGSSFVGPKNYEYLSQIPIFVIYLKNSLWLRLVQILSGLLLSVPVLLWICTGKKQSRKMMKACLCLIPMCLPPLVTAGAVMRFMPREYLVEPELFSVIFGLGCCLQTGGWIAFCGGIFHVLGLRGIGKGLKQGIPAALLLLCLMGLTPEFSTSLLLKNSMNMQGSRTLDLYAYEMGLMSYNLSVSSAVSVVKVVLQCLLGIVPAILLSRMAKEDRTRLPAQSSGGTGLLLTTAQLMWVLVLAACSAVSMGLTTLLSQPEKTAGAVTTVVMQSQVLQGLMNSLSVMMASGLFAGGAACALVCGLKGRKHGLAFVLLILSSSLSCVVGEYLLVHEAGLRNTIYALLFRQPFHPWLILTVMVFSIIVRIAPECYNRKIIPGFICLSAALAWGDYIGSLIHISDHSMMTIAGMLQQLFVSGTLVSSESVSEMEVLMQQASVPVMMLLTGLPAVLMASFGAWFFSRALGEQKIKVK